VQKRLKEADMSPAALFDAPDEDDDEDDDVGKMH